MNSGYVRQQINSTLVRSVLSSKKVRLQFVFVENKDGKIQMSQRGDSPLSSKKRYLVRLPVRPPDKLIESMIDRVILLEKPLSRDQKQLFKEAITKHYSKVEERNLILPILALIKISPSALFHFLSNWKPYKQAMELFHSGSMGFEMIEHVIFRLVWATINDLSTIRNVPTGGDVQAAYVCGGNWSSQEPYPLLRLDWNTQEIIEYEAGFDTIHEYAGGEDDDIVEVETNPENCRVKITWRKQMNPFLEPGNLEQKNSSAR
ncbi:MAG: hypothetical protein ACREBU_14350 [Nitrososphaera sp.]